MATNQQKKIEYSLRGIDVDTVTEATHKIVQSISKVRPVSESEKRDLRRLVFTNITESIEDKG